MVKVPKGHICDVARNSDLHATGEYTGRQLRYLVNAYDDHPKPSEHAVHLRAREELKGARICVEQHKGADVYWYEPPGQTAAQFSSNESWFESLPANNTNV